MSNQEGKIEGTGKSFPGANLGLEAQPALCFGQSGYGSRGESGLVATRVRDGGPAARSGIQAGDVLVEIAGNPLLSRDDLKDFLAVSFPDSEVTVCYLRGSKEQKTIVRLEQAEDGAGAGAFSWDYAGLTQLSQALKHADEKDMNILVGLSGSDT